MEFLVFTIEVVGVSAPTGCRGRLEVLPGPHPPQCAHWGTFPGGEGVARCGGERADRWGSSYGMRRETEVLPGPHPPQCAPWGTFPQGKAAAAAGRGGQRTGGWTKGALRSRKEAKVRAA